MVINEAGFNNTFCYYRYERKVIDWTAVRTDLYPRRVTAAIEKSDRFFENGVELTGNDEEIYNVGDSSNKDRFKKLYMGIESKSDCLLGQFYLILGILDSESEWNKKKTAMWQE